MTEDQSRAPEEVGPDDENTDRLHPKYKRTPPAAAGMKAGMAALPCYQSHKKVWAVKIKEISPDEREVRDQVVSATLTPSDERFTPFHVTSSYMIKHQPQPGGYYVVYKDGYESFSPAEAFEEGYTLDG